MQSLGRKVIAIFTENSVCTIKFFPVVYFVSHFEISSAVASNQFFWKPKTYDLNSKWILMIKSLCQHFQGAVVMEEYLEDFAVFTVLLSFLEMMS